MARNYLKSINPFRPFDLSGTSFFFFDDGIPSEVERADRFGWTLAERGWRVSLHRQVKSTRHLQYWPIIGEDSEEALVRQERLEAKMWGWSRSRAKRLLLDLYRRLEVEGLHPQKRVKIRHELGYEKNLEGKQQFEAVLLDVLGGVPVDYLEADLPLPAS